MKSRQTKTNKISIKKYWYSKLKLKGKIKKITRKEFFEKDHCFACLRVCAHLDRAHIVAHNKGGNDKKQNLHLLCRTCHQQSETYSDDLYWQWFMGQNAFHSLLSEITRYSGISTQKIYNLLMKKELELILEKTGFEFSSDDAEDVAALVYILKHSIKTLENTMGKQKFEDFYYGEMQND